MSNWTLGKNKRHYVFFDSFDRDDKFGTLSTDCTITLPNHQIINPRFFRLEQCTIPQTYYEQFAPIPLEEQAGGGLIYVSIPAGNYSPVQYATAMKTALDSASPNGYTYTVTYSSFTHKFTISTTANFELAYRTAFDAKIDANNYSAGFNNPIEDTGFALSHTSNGTAILGATQFMFLALEGVPTAYTTSRNLTATYMIPIDSNSWEVNFYQNNNEFDNRVDMSSNGRAYSTFRVRLMYFNGNVVDLNGAEWSFCLSYEKW